MRSLRLLTVGALFLGSTVMAQAQSDDGAMMSDEGDDMAMMAPAMTGKLGDETFLMDAHKMTLYTFDNDSAGMSSCYDTCAQNWPPLLASSDADLPNGYSLIERSDGSMQVAYKNQPLYLWAQDMQPGEMSGDGVGGVWHIARP